MLKVSNCQDDNARILEEIAVLNSKVLGLEEELSTLRRENSNLKNAVRRAWDQAHELWYDLGNA